MANSRSSNGGSKDLPNGTSGMLHLYNRPMPLSRTLALATTLLTPITLFVQPLPAQSALSADPAPNKAFPAALESFQLPSHGALLNALVYVAAGPGPHPAVILLHGFPGNEKNLDLAQSLRRSGFTVLYFDYRGSWGTPGDFSFTHSIEDTQAALDYLRTPANASLFRADPHQIILAGHSMGGMIAAYTATHNAQNPDLRATILISAADMAGRAILPAGVPAEALPEARKKLLAGVAHALAAEGIAPLAGCTPESLAQNLIDHPEYALAAQAPKLNAAPLLVITSDDGGAPPAEALVAAIQSAGGQRVASVHIPTDHSYSDARIHLTQTILDFLAQH